MLNKSFNLLTVSFLLTMAIVAVQAKADSNPSSIEVKLTLKTSKVLNGSSQLKSKYRRLFNFKKSPTFYMASYIDDENLSLNQHQTIIRVRHKKDKIDVTYKYRFKNQSIENIEQLVTKNQINQQIFQPQLDWGRQEKSISFAKKTTLSQENNESSIQLAKNNLPQGWTLPQNPKVFGNVGVTKYKGKFDGQKLALEIWSLKSQKLTEISFKTNNLSDATTARTHLINQLDQLQLVAPDSFKTSQVLSEGPQQ